MKRDAMVFPFRWVDSLLELEDDLPVMLVAIREYAEKGEEPNFKGAMAGLWREFKDRIDTDAEKYATKCERNRENVKKRWMRDDTNVYDRMRKHTNGYERIRNDAKNTDGEGEGEGDLKKKPTCVGKEKAPADAVSSAAAEKESFVESSLKPTADYVKWSEEQFRRSVSAAVEKHPEYKPCVEDFSRYWLEPDRKGKYRFALEKTWSTAGRLATWYQRQLQRGGIQQTTSSGWHRDPKTGIVTGTADEDSYAEWKRNGGF